MFVRRYEKQTRSEVAQRYYACKRCDAHGEVAFPVHGSSGWMEDSVWATRDVHTRAQAAAERSAMNDADRVLGLIACPTCKLRQPGAVGWAWTRIGIWCALGAVLPIWWVWAAPVAGGAAIWQAVRERARFRRARGAVITRLVHGQLPAPAPRVAQRLAPPPELPVARAIAAPLPREEPADPASGPRFLVEK